MPTSRLARRPWLGSSTSPPLTRRSNLSLGPMAARAGPGPSPVADRARADADPASARNSRREVAGIGVLRRLYDLPRTVRPPSGRIKAGRALGLRGGGMVGGERIELPTSSV